MTTKTQIPLTASPDTPSPVTPDTIPASSRSDNNTPESPPTAPSIEPLPPLLPTSRNCKREREGLRRRSKRLSNIAYNREKLGSEPSRQRYNRRTKRKINSVINTSTNLSGSPGEKSDKESDTDGSWDSDDLAGCNDDDDMNEVGGMASKIWLHEQAMENFDDKRIALRMGIAFYYQTTLDSPEKREWGGRDGTISHVCDVFNLPRRKRRKVKRILEEIEWCEKNKIKYNGKDRRQFNKSKPSIILPGSEEEKIIADWMECNLGLRNITIMVNAHRLEEGRQPVGRNAVMNAFDRMHPKVDKVAKVPQGSLNYEPQNGVFCDNRNMASLGCKKINNAVP